MDGADVKKMSLPELAVHLGEQVTRLVRQELMLARAELFASGRQAATGGGLFAGAAVVGFTGWLALIAAAIAGIAKVVPVWASALIVGAALCVIAAALAMAGRAKVKRGMPPLAMTTGSVRRELHELSKVPHSRAAAMDESGTTALNAGNADKAGKS